jgi:DNA-binding winged helix-turn-helix (wHTH) protein
VNLCERCLAEIATRSSEMPAEHFDRETRTVLVGGERRRLRPQEWNLLEILWRRRESRVSVESIMTLLITNASDHIVKTLVRTVRRALDGSPYGIDNEPKLGYRLARNESRRPVIIGEIEDGVPIPKPNWRRAHPYDGYKYPFRNLSVGQSVLVRDGDPHKVESACSVAGRRLGRAFAMRTVDCGVRVWRTA